MLSHVEIYVSDLERSARFWDWLLRLLGYEPLQSWAEGRSWMTPGLLLERGNFVRDVLFPDINFAPPDRANPSADVRIEMNPETGSERFI